LARNFLQAISARLAPCHHGTRPAYRQTSLLSIADDCVLKTPTEPNFLTSKPAAAAAPIRTATECAASDGKNEP
jgi:hypothetical protein